MLDIAYGAVMPYYQRISSDERLSEMASLKNTGGKTTSLRSRLFHTHLNKTPNVYETSRALGDTDSIHKYFPTPLLNDVKSGYLFASFANWYRGDTKYNQPAFFAGDFDL